jgi:hypothetical protein
MHDNRLDIAERILKPHLKDDPFDVRAIRMLAEVAARIGRLKDSEKLLRRALEIAPAFTVLGGANRPGVHRPSGQLLSHSDRAEPRLSRNGPSQES